MGAPAEAVRISLGRVRVVGSPSFRPRGAVRKMAGLPPHWEEGTVTHFDLGGHTPWRVIAALARAGTLSLELHGERRQLGFNRPETPGRLAPSDLSSTPALREAHNVTDQQTFGEPPEQDRSVEAAHGAERLTWTKPSISRIEIAEATHKAFDTSEFSFFSIGPSG